MSVLVKDRSQSQLAYYYDAIKLRKSITRWMLRDFGIKDKIRSVDYEAKMAGMSEEDKEELTSILEFYNLGNKLKAEFPEWLIVTFRKAMMNALLSLTNSITLADNIEGKTQAERDEKRIYQDRAIGYCNTLLQEMQYAMDVFMIDIEKFMPYVEQIQKEIENLKQWRSMTEKNKGKEGQTV